MQLLGCELVVNVAYREMVAAFYLLAHAEQ